MAITWTDQQRKVIDLRDRSLLVSAAAGSGKTAVLVERIIKRITEGENPPDVDKLLVVTFTNAAAAQIRERVQQAIEKRLEADPRNRHLKRQQILIRQAKITTIDSFCLSVLREQFQQIDLDPSFRIGDEGELKLLQEDVLQALIEERCQEADPAFLDFWEAYNPGRDDTKAASLILNLYEFAMASPRPEKWLRECRKAYQVSTPEELEKTEWMKGLCSKASRIIKELIRLERSALEEFEQQGDMPAYEQILREELSLLEQAGCAQGYRQLRAALNRVVFGKKPRYKKTDTYDEDRAVKIWQKRVRVKEEVEKLRGSSFGQEPEELLKLHLLAGKQADILAELTEDFIEKYGAAKRKRNLVDFHDLEHLALDILSEETEKGEIPTDVAGEYAARFEEIMIDEYQDSNYVQELILNSISRERDGKPNCFMVGDVKQSIYSFRLARPELFMHKYETYTQEESLHQKIELHQNFRSREEVLEGVNYFFRQIMHKSLGNVEYSEEAALHPGMKYEETELPAGGPVKLLLLDTENAPVPQEEEEAESEIQTEREEAGNGSEEQASVRYNAREWEAMMIADEILRLTDRKQGKQIWDEEKKCYRPAAFGDITILLRTMSGWAEDFLPVLAARGIPAAAESGTGYFSALEVQNVINLLRIIDNPRQDIPLAGVLRSPIGGFSDNELARIRLGAQENEDGLYGVLRSYVQNHEKDALTDKLGIFFDRLNDYREKSSYLPLHELVSYVMEESGYYEYVCAMPGSERRRANLDMLAEKAFQFESTSYHGVFQFVRYLEKLRSYSVDYPEAADKADADAVRIMSIHKSKGLEFPIVIVAGLGKHFNEQDSRQQMILHPDYGIGADAIDTETRTTAPTLMKKALAREITLDSLGEELRVLYVAMTRAKEILILSGAKKAMTQWLETCLSELDADTEELSYLELSSAHSYLDWIVPAMAKNESFDDIYRRLNLSAPYSSPWYRCGVRLEARLVTAGELETAAAAKRLDAAWYKRQLEEWESWETDDRDENFIRERVSFNYCYDDMYRIAASLSVSEIKKQFMEEEQQEEKSLFPAEREGGNTLPAFMRTEEKISGAKRGTLYHWLFCHLDPCREESFEEQTAKFTEKGILDAGQLAAVSMDDFTAFYRTSLGQRSRRARQNGTFHAETPFCLGIPAAKLNEGARVRKNDYVKIHGIIDAWFEEDGKIVLLDYKTDRIFQKEWEEILTQRYRIQLCYYRMALEKMTGRPVDEVYLYSVTRRKAVQVRDK